ncbi:tetratricopeptide repeat protein [Campylobacter geochelonis]|uniref:beta-lactamase n=1 Tax=Campylobacter geochelonis TaxID=1780362 RepID=A0A128EGY0_9BACT|nr:tetratricopeptide repeat protein [Campylobacter geochelonis]QKF71379.1 Sel1 domain-containing protein [Campylobacter geochelonis]CZE48154.1 beta-lactamase HcpA [Campylobacter geochelonis]CZE49146.1 beta-lactamase HcpA [Campylobacter geochelonis]CZE51468.1 beta-lactamase HcpA [Campylobacter geochelonis]
MKKIFLTFVLVGCWLNLALASDLGKGFNALTSGDFKSAFENFKLACDKNDALGCNALGNLYKKGKGVEQNNELAKKYYKKACELGLKPACDSQDNSDKN